MTLAAASAKKVKEGIEKPVEQEEHFYLLPEMDFLMPDKLGLVVCLFPYPDEDEK